jgi:predicted MFS family arabinose efflux permease
MPDLPATRWLGRNRSVAFIAAATAFSLLGDQVLYAVLPVYYQDLGLTPIQVGILLSANRWIRLLTNELAHRLGQGAAQRAIFLGAFALGALTTAAYALTSWFSLLFAARLIWGLSWSFIRHIGVQTIMAEAPADQAGRTMGVYNGISRAGSVAGLLGGAVLVDVFGFAAGVLMLAVVSLFSLPLAHIGFRPAASLPDHQSGTAPVAVLAMGFVIGAVGPGFVMGTLGAALAGYVTSDAWLSAATLTGVLLGTRYLMDSVAAAWLGSVTDTLGLRRAAGWFFFVGGLALLAAASKPPAAMFVVAIIGFFVCGTGLHAGVAATASRIGSGAFARYVTASDFGAACGPLGGWLVVAWLGDPAWSLAIGGVVYLVGVAVTTQLAVPDAQPS